MRLRPLVRLCLKLFGGGLGAVLRLYVDGECELAESSADVLPSAEVLGDESKGGSAGVVGDCIKISGSSITATCLTSWDGEKAPSRRCGESHREDCVSNRLASTAETDGGSRSACFT